jgi:hypothetical protein
MKGFETDVFFLNDSIDLIKNDAEYIRTITTAEDGSESNDATKQIKKDIITVIDRCDGMKLKLKGKSSMLHSSSYLTVRSLLLQDTIMRSIVYAMR